MKNKKITTGKEPVKRPQAWIAVSNNRQKIYQDQNSPGKVYLTDGQEFQIELYNPTTTAFVAKIHINGTLMSYSGIVIKPGQRYFLDRFIDVDRKLTFSTYDVDNTKETQAAIANNGLVKIDFYPEQPPAIGNYWWNTGTITTNYPPTFTTYTRGPVFRDYGNYSTPVSTFSSSSTLYCSDATYFCNTLSHEGKSIETGRIEGGSKSDQEFDSDHGVYSSWAAFTDTYKILPNSTKPVEVSEIRSYCTECGTRVKKANWKFCPTCGEGLK